MNNVLTLIGNPAARDLGADVEERVCDALADRGAVIGQRVWLAPGLALDVAFTDLAPAAAYEGARAVLGEAAIDIVAQVHQDRRKGLLIADMDSTIIDVECIDEIADIAGHRGEVSRLTARAMRGEIDFADALRQRTALLGGLTATQLEEVYRTRIRLNPGARELVATMRDHGAFTALVLTALLYIQGSRSSTRSVAMLGDWRAAARVSLGAFTALVSGGFTVLHTSAWLGHRRRAFIATGSPTGSLGTCLHAPAPMPRSSARWPAAHRSRQGACPRRREQAHRPTRAGGGMCAAG